MNDIIDSLNWRYATKKFDSRKLTEQQLDTLIEALRLTASSFGLQLWKFLIIEDQEIRDRLISCSWNQHQVAEASHLIVFTRPTTVTDQMVDDYLDLLVSERGTDRSRLKDYEDVMKNKIREMSEKDMLASWLSNQAYIALGNLLTVAAVEKIDACPMEGFDHEAVDKVLELDKQELNSIVMCPVGFRSEEDKYARVKKVRYPVDRVVQRV